MRLAPVQRQALESLLAQAKPGTVTGLSAGSGTGRTTVLAAAHRELGGTMLGIRDVQRALEVPGRHPLAIEEAFHRLLSEALDASDVVLLDDMHLLVQVLVGCHSYPRSHLIAATIQALTERVELEQKRLIFGMSPHAAFWRPSGGLVAIQELQPRDYRSVCESYLERDIVDRMDFERVRRQVRQVSARMLRLSCEALRDDPALDADVLVDYLRAHFLISNVDLGEVQAVDLRELRGLEDVIEALEANIILPLENAELADRLALRPKRGVLLAGPPGTGKTTIGRALAHRLRSKFFLIDGGFIAGTPQFFSQIHHVFEEAKRNAPAIVFVDDSDVIFESGEENGLYRYLLTLLDGLESRSAGGICLMMTAMDVSSLPPALVRSGRIELWLETRLPEAQARGAILADRCAALPAEMGAVDYDEVVRASEGMSGADLKRVVEDAKLAYAFDVARGSPKRGATLYLVSALSAVRANKERYSAAEAAARVRNPHRAPYFGFMGGMMMDEHMDLAIMSDGE